jgi:2-haloacid dehalogenase
MGTCHAGVPEMGFRKFLIMRKIETIIFDLGGVLIDWNPRYLYRKIFSTEEEISWFLETVCTGAWNEQQDAGRSSAEAIAVLVNQFPQHEVAIRSWFDRWPETIGGSIHDTVDILKTLHEMKQHRLYALTNWSAETFPWAKNNFDFLRWFEGIVVSGEEKTLKPNLDFYQILLDRYSVDPGQALFIDDNIKNTEAAKVLGIDSIHFKKPSQLRQELMGRGIALRI